MVIRVAKPQPVGLQRSLCSQVYSLLSQRTRILFPASIPDHNHSSELLSKGLQHPLLSSKDTRFSCYICIHAGNMLIPKIKINNKNREKNPTTDHPEILTGVQSYNNYKVKIGSYHLPSQMGKLRDRLRVHINPPALDCLRAPSFQESVCLHLAVTLGDTWFL